mmetsp:Transcript_33175/g.59371  ORF Transcript_33175/g.59371 Transcript_33175/m.59371 type:complete len:83 (-) Transcript_33175:345-593(-)
MACLTSLECSPSYRDCTNVSNSVSLWSTPASRDWAHHMSTMAALIVGTLMVFTLVYVQESESELEAVSVYADSARLEVAFKC